MIPRLGLLCQSFWPSFQAFGEQFLHLTHIFFGKKQLFSTLTKRKRTVFRTWPVSSKELAQTNAKGAFCGAGSCRLCIHHRDTFVYFYQAAFPGFRLRMDKGIIANFSGAFIKFVMICMVCVMKCLAWVPPKRRRRIPKFPSEHRYQPAGHRPGRKRETPRSASFFQGMDFSENIRKRCRRRRQA